jgi:hypothetical protein
MFTRKHIYTHMHTRTHAQGNEGLAEIVLAIRPTALIGVRCASSII